LDVKDLKDPLKYRAVILDTIHKFIQVNNLEYILLQTPFLNRLHRIKQLGFTYLVFPSAKHTRFEHSLGVMHLAGRIAERLVRKSGELLLTKRSQKAERYFIEIARLAGLLHDLGHLPYSHNLEEPMQHAFEAPRDFNLDPSKIADIDLSNRKLHEIATEHFIQKIIEEFEDIYGGIVVDLLELAKASLSPNKKLSGDSLTELGIREESIAVVSQIISHKIVDADRLDYLLRDAHATGVLFGYIDIERLIDSLYIDKNGDDIVVSLDPKGIPAVEDAYDARFKMYRSVYYHHKNIALTLSLTKLLPHLFENWSSLTGFVYRNCISSPEKIFDLEHLADCISKEEVLFADPEFETILLLAAKSPGPLGRWSSPLLLRRDLIPISLVKRPDELISRVLAEVRNLKGGGNVPSEALVRAFEGTYPFVVDELKKRTRELARVNPDNFNVEMLFRQIISEQNEVLLPGGYPSIYFKNLLDSGRAPLVYVYVYGEDIETHKKLLKRARELRTLAGKLIVDLAKESLVRES
jgi:HD superfamily phosphohydrolase